MKDTPSIQVRPVSGIFRGRDRNYIKVAKLKLCYSSQVFRYDPVDDTFYFCTALKNSDYSLSRIISLLFLHSFNKKGPVPIGCDEKSAPSLSTSSFGRT